MLRIIKAYRKNIVYMFESNVTLSKNINIYNVFNVSDTVF
jgi:hypothetical protein